MTPRTNGRCADRSAQIIGGGGGNVDVIPPPWAKFVRLELSDCTLLSTTFVELLDVNATTRGRYAR